MRVLAGFLAAWIFSFTLSAQTLRPVKDEVGFCWNASGMEKLVKVLESEQEREFTAEGLVAAISPHDDYLYAGRVYFPLFRILKAREVVIFGVTHGNVRKEMKDPLNILILDEFDQWTGLKCPMPVSGLRDVLKTELKQESCIVSNKAHELEHSIEAMIPFLQYYNPGVKITPLMVAPMPVDRMRELSEELAGVIAGYMKERNLKPGTDIFFLISADGNHYGKDFGNAPYGEDEKARETALEVDRHLISSYLTGTLDTQKIRDLTEKLRGKTFLDYGSSYWCGKYSIPFGLFTVEKVIGLTMNKKVRGELFCFSDTYSEGVIPLTKTGMGITAPFSLKHWVSFFSIGYYAE